MSNLALFVRCMRVLIALKYDILYDVNVVNIYTKQIDDGFIDYTSFMFQLIPKTTILLSIKKTGSN